MEDAYQSLFVILPVGMAIGLFFFLMQVIKENCDCA
jgi:hypothetical protein